MYFSYGIFVDNRVPNFWGEFDSCLNFYTKCTPPLCFAQQNIGEVSRRTEGLKKRSKGNGLGCNLPSPAVSRSITGYYVSHIEETPQKR